LGISLEGTVDVEDGKEVRPHHYIRNILPDGPVGRNKILQAGDELLEVGIRCYFHVRSSLTLITPFLLYVQYHNELVLWRIVNSCVNYSQGRNNSSAVQNCFVVDLGLI
jgi:hypothetical protein